MGFGFSKCPFEYPGCFLGLRVLAGSRRWQGLHSPSFKHAVQAQTTVPQITMEMMGSCRFSISKAHVQQLKTNCSLGVEGYRTGGTTASVWAKAPPVAANCAMDLPARPTVSQHHHRQMDEAPPHCDCGQSELSAGCPGNAAAPFCRWGWGRKARWAEVAARVIYGGGRRTVLPN